MIDPFGGAFYHFWSSGLVGLLGLAWIYSTSTGSSSADRDGSTSWISSRQFFSLLVLSAWTHIFADVIEHGGPPGIVQGMQGLTDFLLSEVFGTVLALPP